MIRRPPISPLFPYPTFFRSLGPVIMGDAQVVRAQQLEDGARRDGRHVAPLVIEPPGIALRRRPVTDKGQAWSAHGDQLDHRSEEHTSELQSQSNLVCRLLLE